MLLGIPAPTAWAIGLRTRSVYKDTIYKDTKGIRPEMTLTRRGAIMVGLGLVLTVGLLGFAVTPAQALSISGTYTDIAFGSAGTGGAIANAVQPGLVGGPGSSLVNGFPSTGTLGNNFWSIAQGTGISADAFGS